MSRFPGARVTMGKVGNSRVPCGKWRLIRLMGAYTEPRCDPKQRSFLSKCCSTLAHLVGPFFMLFRRRVSAQCDSLIVAVKYVHRSATIGIEEYGVRPKKRLRKTVLIATDSPQFFISYFTIAGCLLSVNRCVQPVGNQNEQE